MSDDYLEKLYASMVLKGRVYVDDPSEAPEGVDVQQGEQGGYFYDSGGGDSSGEGGSSGNSGGGAQEVTVDDMDNPAATIEMLADTIGENAAEYGHDAERAYRDFSNRVRDGEDVAEALNSVMEGTTAEGLQEMLARDMGLPYDTGEDGGGEGGVTGYTGELPWGEKPQRVAAGIASDVAQEAQEGGAYEYRDDVEVADIAEESAREYARENDLDEELFVDEVREQVRMNLEDAAEYGNNQERGQSDSGSDSEEEEDGSDDDDDGMVEIRVLGGEDDEAETIEAPREVNGWEYEQGALGGTIVWQGESDDRWVSWSKTSSNAWMAQLKTEDDRVNRTARDPELALTYAKRLMQENDPDAGDGAE